MQYKDLNIKMSPIEASIIVSMIIINMKAAPMIDQKMKLKAMGEKILKQIEGQLNETPQIIDMDALRS